MGSRREPLFLTRLLFPANRCRRLRQERGIRQYRLAEPTRISKPMLCRCEKGRNGPAVPLLVRLLKVLDCDAETFGRRLGPWSCISQNRRRPQFKFLNRAEL
jgi:transcriptional regulator with XRE-family HTH domain